MTKALTPEMEFLMKKPYVWNGSEKAAGVEGSPESLPMQGVAAVATGSEISGWIVELQPGCWLAPWGGDPGRTLVKDSAEVFPTKKAAEDALDRASDFREWTAPALVPVRTLQNK